MTCSVPWQRVQPAPAAEQAVLVAGGIGVAPLLSLAQFLNRGRRTISRTVIIGGATRGDILCRSDFKETGARVAVSTEDGSSGTGGWRPTCSRTFLIPFHRKLQFISPFTHAGHFPCSSVSQPLPATGHPLPGFAGEHHGLRSGRLPGCSVPVRSKTGRTISYQRVCKEGPVFDSTAIDWECLAGC